MTGAQAQAAGWYPDPSNPQLVRWWDGTAWTDQTQAAGDGGTPLATVPSGGAATSTHGGSAGAADPRFDHDRFVVRQWRRLTVHKYEVHAGEGNGPKFGLGPVVSYVQQKRMSLRDKIWFYDDKNKGRELFDIQSQRKMDFGGRHDVMGADGQLVGRINKKLGMNLLFRSEFTLEDANGSEIAHVKEKSLMFAILRRWGPEILEIFPYDFVVHASGNSQQYGVAPGTLLGHHKRRWGFRDTYDMDLTGDPGRMIDRRLAVALAVGLDALQHR
jgi:uncharacterized protein YxjI